jgi:hypothetical protein
MVNFLAWGERSVNLISRLKRSKIAFDLVTFLVACFLAPCPRPALAAEVVGYGALAAAFVYYAYLNRPGAKMDWSLRGPGGFFIGGFAGGSLVQNTNWHFTPGAQDPRYILNGNVDTSPVDFAPGVVGGLKFGYFLHRLPYVGLEAEFNFTRTDVQPQNITLSRPIRGSTQATLSAESFYIPTLALHFLGRYGFLPDQEVPIGRLQPYVGLGPGFIIVFGPTDSAKNFSLEAEAGVRYMLLKNPPPLWNTSTPCSGPLNWNTRVSTR